MIELILFGAVAIVAVYWLMVLRYYLLHHWHL